MRKNKGKGRKLARQLRLEKEDCKKVSRASRVAPHYSFLFLKLKENPDFRKGSNKRVLLKSEVDAALNGKKVTAHKRKKIAAKLKPIKENK